MVVSEALLTIALVTVSMANFWIAHDRIAENPAWLYWCNIGSGIFAGAWAGYMIGAHL